MWGVRRWIQEHRINGWLTAVGLTSVGDTGNLRAYVLALDRQVVDVDGCVGDGDRGKAGQDR